MRPFQNTIALKGLAGLFLVLSLSSCVSVNPDVTPGTTATQPTRSANVRRADVTHIVAPGETFWRISQMYDVPMDTIARANRLSASSGLRMGQRLTIPNAAPLKPVISLYPSNKWKYIVVHHSATGEGSALAFHKSHLERGWDRGVGYHFVIDNHTGGKTDGQVEVTPRWIKQQDGAHCKADDMNLKGIGICLVGNFNDGQVSEQQMSALVDLVKRLSDYYRIPEDRIIRHGDARGATTECPGNKFPWDEFRRRVRRGY